MHDFTINTETKKQKKMLTFVLACVKNGRVAQRKNEEQ